MFLCQILQKPRLGGRGGGRLRNRKFLRKPLNPQIPKKWSQLACFKNKIRYPKTLNLKSNSSHVNQSNLNVQRLLLPKRFVLTSVSWDYIKFHFDTKNEISAISHLWKPLMYVPTMLEILVKISPFSITRFGRFRTTKHWGRSAIHYGFRPVWDSKEGERGWKLCRPSFWTSEITVQWGARSVLPDFADFP